tara:strand:+ start:9504 stop:9659 length:156 start_codon:yes stop_codon:yes gene_type:complete
MRKNEKIFSGNLASVPDKQIYLNINNLVEGSYTLKIIQDKKVIMEVNFEKK